MSLQDIQSRIAAAEAQAGRAPGAVSADRGVQGANPTRVCARCLEAGHRVFGENRVQEAAGKWPGFRDTFGPFELHLLGPLQTNKARQAMELFDIIHSVDRPKLARTLARLAQELGHCPGLFVQVNTGAEPQKAGILASRCRCHDRRMPRP